MNPDEANLARLRKEAVWEDKPCRTHEVIRQCGGIVHSDGNIFFRDRYQFENAASILLGCATVMNLNDTHGVDSSGGGRQG